VPGVPARLPEAGRAFMPLAANESGVNRLRDAHLHLSNPSFDDTASIRLGETRW
jgi:hypothetical protein